MLMLTAGFLQLRAASFFHSSVIQDCANKNFLPLFQRLLAIPAG